MANPLVSQGTLNRLRASVIWNDFPQLNVTPGYLGRDMIRLSLDGDATTFINTATGAVTSPEPYMGITLRMHLLKSQALSDAYKVAMQASTLLGNGTVRPDAATLSPYDIVNCGIMGVEPLDFSGLADGWVVSVRGFYYINNNLWG